MFCILENFEISWFPEPELCVIPAVACLLPFGSLWAGSMQNQNLETNSVVQARHGAGPAMVSSEARPLVSGSGSSAHTTAFQPVNTSGPIHTTRITTSPITPTYPETPLRVASNSNAHHLDRHYPELAEEDGIAVHRNYSVTSSRRSPTTAEHPSSMV